MSDLLKDIKVLKIVTRAQELAKNGDYYGSMSVCSEAISEGMKDVRLYNHRAYAYLDLGKSLINKGDREGGLADFRRARLDLEASLALNPNDSWVRDTIADLKKIC